jgi:hypothetical protein
VGDTLGTLTRSE